MSNEYKTRKEAIESAIKELEKEGWQKEDAGQKRGTDFNDFFLLYTRKRPLKDLYEERQKNEQKIWCQGGQKNGDFSKNAPIRVLTNKTENPSTMRVSDQKSALVSNSAMGYPKQASTPMPKIVPPELEKVMEKSDNLPVLSITDQLPSLAILKDGSPSLVIAYDSEWFYSTENCFDDDLGLGSRELLSWQFALVFQDELREYVFIRLSSDHILSLEHALGRILDDLDLPTVDTRKVVKYSSLSEYDAKKGKYKEIVYSSKKEAESRAISFFSDGKKVHTINDWENVSKIPVTLLCHAGKVDISALDQNSSGHKSFLNYCSEVQGGLVSLNPISIHPDTVDPAYANNHHSLKYNISLQMADTMCHAPEKKQKLEDLGFAISWEKIMLAKDTKEHMDKLLQRDPCLFFEYASNDSVIALLYIASIYGYNTKPPVTLTSASAKIMRGTMMEYLGCETTEEFDRVYRGLHRVNHGDIPNPDKPGYVANSSLEPISDSANTVQFYFSKAFRGGYNASFDIGYFPEPTFDYDLHSAYASAMCLVPDVDWENPINREVTNKELTLSDFVVPLFGGYAPLTMMAGYVRFEFPKDVKYPCIPVVVEGMPIYPRTSEGFDGVYACGPEIYLALRLGAKVYCERGYFINGLMNKDEQGYTYSMRAAIKQLVQDRDQAKIGCGKGSLEELILKRMANSGYGKTAQNVIQKQTWSAYKGTMENMGCSAITNPVSACMITSIIRATLLAAQNQCGALGYITPSVTTDGFISNIPKNELRSLDLFGFQNFMAQSRYFLTNGKSDEIWEAKHAQDDLLNFTTRGNVSLYWLPPFEQRDTMTGNPYVFDGKGYAGVCAHAGLKSGYLPDSYEDRAWLLKSVVSRTDKVAYERNEWTGFRELVEGKEFSARVVVSRLNMDFDMKRKPEKESFFPQFITLEDGAYEVATFSTLPYENADEFLRYRSTRENCKCLRTMEDWKMFWFKLQIKETGSNVKTREEEWTILFQCIKGHRQGLFTIPKLDELRGQARNEWINSHNTSGKPFTDNDWKNAGRKERSDNLLDKELLADKLSELMED